MTAKRNSLFETNPPAYQLMQRACRVPLGSGWSADDPDPGARAGKPTPPWRQSVQPTLRLGVVVAGLLPFPQPPRKQARLITRAPSLRRGAVQPSLSHPVDAAGLLVPSRSGHSLCGGFRPPPPP